MGSTSIFSGVTSGLNSTYSILATASSGSVTATNVANAMSSSTYASSLSSGFASYILSNFSVLDQDNDGTLSSTEMSSLSNTINATGLTSTQLTQLGSASGLSGETLEQVLTHFADIDANGDGKVTSSEISNYKLSSAMEKKKTEFANKAASNQSLFYGDDNSSSEVDSSSMLSFKYWDDGSDS